MHVDPIEKTSYFRDMASKNHGFFAFFADFDQFINGLLTMHADPIEKKHTFETCLQKTMGFLHLLQTSINLSMGFLTMHADPMEKKQHTFETWRQKPHGCFAHACRSD